MKFQHSACLIPALFQTAMMILFAAWSCFPEAVLENAGLPQNYDIMPYLIPLTLLCFAACFYLWLSRLVRTHGKETNRFGISLIVILLDIAVMGAFMPPMEQVTERAKRSSCAANLAQIMTALTAYEQRYGTMPPFPEEKGLDLLRKTGLLTDPFLLLCPGDGTCTPVPLDEPLTPDHCGYLYTPPVHADDVILQDRRENHPLFRHEVRRSGISGSR